MHRHLNYTLTGIATNTSDYTTLGGTVTIPANSSSQQVTVAPIDDMAVEGGETVILTLAASSSYALGSPVSATLNIADNDTHPPSANITSPASGAIYTAPASIVIDAAASDSDGSVTKVEFFQGSTKLGEDTVAPYSLTWSNVAAGNYSLMAKATDNMGATSTSVAVNVVVNQPPTANAGGPYSGTSGSAIHFDASASTDMDGTITSYEWNFGDGTTGSGATPMHAYASSGTYTATLTVTDNLGAQASATTTITVSTPFGNGTGLRGRYFDQIDFNDFKISRLDATLDFDWSTGSPHASLGAETFAVQWTGQVVPRYSETYTFYTHSDDGVKLWVNHQLLVDNWTEHAFTENSGQITLQAGCQYDIRLEYFENYGGATAKLLWSSASQPKEVIPQSQLYPCWKSVEQFVRDFYQGVLARQPDAGELQNWRQRMAQAQGGALLLQEAQELSRSLFRSAEYAGRNRDNRQYVEDLYWGYLQRDPAEDEAGWDYWTNQVNADPSNGRTSALRAFEQSGEFAEQVNKLCDTSVASSGYNFSEARIEPSNRTGQPDADLRSGNYNWTLPLLSLPGRSGLDLGLTLSYNSLIWTRDGSATAISFDADRGFPSPGFRLGFPVLQPRFYNPQTGRYAYLLINSAGQRVELRQVVGSVNTYESADATYTQLVDNGDGSLTLRTPDGTQLSYWLMGGDYQCTEIKDRNGNYITARYDSYGQLQSVTDTLARTVNFRYDAYQNLISIWQTWTVDGRQQEHVYATFGYADRTINTNFSNMTVIGPHNGEVLPLLTQVGLDDGSYYKFEYMSWGQVSKITRYAADSNPQSDNHPLSYTSYNLPQDNGEAHSDCPRYTERREWAENWNGDEGDGVADASEEAVTSYHRDPSGAGAWCEVTMPDRTTVYKEYFGTAWQKNLTMQTETYELAAPGAALPSTPKKKSIVVWTQDDTSLPYPDNPRVEETNISDDENHRRRTRIEYLPSNVSAFRLPWKTYEYKADATTILRRTQIEYQLEAAYIDRRVIGLIRERSVYAEDPLTGGDTLLSKLTYQYDEAGEFLKDDGEPVQHDGAYAIGFVTGRANLTGVRRWDAESPDVPSQSVESKVGYNTAGAVVFSQDALGHRTEVEYTDKFADDASSEGASRHTLAYPTASTDPDQHGQPISKKSRLWYNYDRGLVTRTQDLKDSVTTYQYDAANRIKEVITLFNRAKTRWEYPADFSYVHQYSTVEAGQSEAHSWQVTDGAGRVIGTASDHPGSAGGYRAQDIIYDVMGRVVRRSTSTAIDSAWQPQDEDPQDGVAAGWYYQKQSYDWQGRPLVSTHVDGTTREALYGGCGCAGGQVVTTRDEVGRRRKLSYDVLGRLVKMQDLSTQPKHEALSEAGTIYRTTSNLYNGRDQVIESQTHAGEAEADPSKIQKSVMQYDGHGRLKSRQTPIQTSPTSFLYHADDTVWRATDARGVTATFTYNNRHLTRRVEYTVPATVTDVAATAPVEMDYDVAGHRLWMTDGLGRMNYNYDTLSRMTAETRTFSDPDNAAINGTTKTLSYDYNLAGELKSLTDPDGSRIDYSYDHAGQLTAVTGTPYAGVSNYASSMQYRAWGAVKALTYGNGRTLSVAYNPRLQVSRFQIPGVVNADYQYSSANSNDNDGRVKFVRDLQQTNSPFDRAYRYDLVGRLTTALSGSEARGGNVADGPYHESYSFDVWDNMTGHTTRHWSDYYESAPAVEAASGRNGAWMYDAGGRVLEAEGRRYQIDAAGRITEMTDEVTRLGRRQRRTQRRFYDGEGRWMKEVKNGVVTYHIRSAVLGGRVVTELNATGEKLRTKVYTPEGEVVAEQANGEVVWQHRTPFDTAEWKVDARGTVRERVELDPLRADVGLVAPPELDEGGAGEPQPMFPAYGDPSAADGYLLDSMPVSKFQLGLLLFSAQARSGLPSQLGGGLPGTISVVVPEYEMAWGYSEEITSGGGAQFDGQGNAVLSGAEVLVTASQVGYLQVLGVGQTLSLTSQQIASLRPEDFGENPERWTKLKNLAFADAKDALLKDAKCRQFLGLDKQQVTGLVRALWMNAQFANLRSDAGTIGEGKSATILLSRRFFSDTAYKAALRGPSAYGPNDPMQWRALTVLHEIAHALNRIPSDKDSLNQSLQNDRKVYEECQRGISTLYRLADYGVSIPPPR